VKELIDNRHPQREAFARWIRKEGIDPDRVASITFNGASPRSSRTATLVLLKRRKGKIVTLGNEAAVAIVSHRIKHRPPKIRLPEPEIP